MSCNCKQTKTTKCTTITSCEDVKYIDIDKETPQPFNNLDLVMGLDAGGTFGVFENGISSDTEERITALETSIVNKVNKDGDTMTGTLTLSNPPVNPDDAATKEYVDSHISQGTAGFVFKGYLSTLQPVIDVREGNYWIEGTTLPVAPNFPVMVHQYTNGQWTDVNVSYTPSAMDLWVDINDTQNQNSFFYMGDVWEHLDFNSNSFNPDLFETDNAQITLKGQSVTDYYIRNVDSNKVIINNSNDRDLLMANDTKITDAGIGLDDMFIMSRGIYLDFQNQNIGVVIENFLSTVKQYPITEYTKSNSYYIYGKYNANTTNIPEEIRNDSRGTFIKFQIWVTYDTPSSRPDINGICTYVRNIGVAINIYAINKQRITTIITYNSIVNSILSTALLPANYYTTNTAARILLVPNANINCIQNQEVDLAPWFNLTPLAGILSIGIYRMTIHQNIRIGTGEGNSIARRIIYPIQATISFAQNPVFRVTLPITYNINGLYDGIILEIL